MTEKEESVHLTITIPKSVRARMNDFPEINWSGVATRAFRKQIDAQMLVRSYAEEGITDEEAIKRGLSLRHGKKLERPNVAKNH